MHRSQKEEPTDANAYLADVAMEVLVLVQLVADGAEQAVAVWLDGHNAPADAREMALDLVIAGPFGSAVAPCDVPKQAAQIQRLVVVVAMRRLTSRQGFIAAASAAAGRGHRARRRRRRGRRDHEVLAGLPRGLGEVVRVVAGSGALAANTAVARLVLARRQGAEPAKGRLVEPAGSLGLGHGCSIG